MDEHTRRDSLVLRETVCATIWHPPLGNHMPLIIDPAKVEAQALKQAVAWRGKRVLELGCGAGRLTLRLASLGPSRIDALDPDPDEIRLARRNLPARLRGLIHYGVGQAEHIRKSDGAFDIVVFSWAL